MKLSTSTGVSRSDEIFVFIKVLRLNPTSKPWVGGSNPSWITNREWLWNLGSGAFSFSVYDKFYGRIQKQDFKQDFILKIKNGS